jgi:excisionase family DNA binding protein
MRQPTEPSRHAALLSTKEVAKFLGVPVNTVYVWQTRGGGPPGYRVGRHTRYRPDEVLAWLEHRRLETKGSPAEEVMRTE